MRLASANIRNFHRRLRRQGLAALQVMNAIDPKSIERSTVFGIALFAAASVALQGFVVAQGSISGKKSGAAQAALAPTKAQLIGAADAAPAAPRQDLEVTRLSSTRRGDRLDPESLGLIGTSGLPRLAGLVPADTIFAKNVAAAASPALGLRESTFAPASIYERDARPSGVSLTSRLPTDMTTASLPKPTRVAFAGTATGHVRSLADAVPRDRGAIIDVSPPARAPAQFKRSSRKVPDAIVQKVHFQEHTPDRCLPTELMNVIYDVAERFGEVQVLSTFRDPDRNRRVGGAPRSFHLRCQAIDFRVMGRSPGLLQYLESREDVGGLKRYPLGFYHIDTGPRRTW